MFLAFSNEISTVQKIVLSSRRGQGNFRGLEAKAKALIFEAKAKAKDFKMCPRGQGRPRGLHLCSVVPSIVTYKIYYVLETVPVVHTHKHFDKERTLPHKFKLNHYLIF